MNWRRKWQPTPVFLPGESQGQRSLVGPSMGSHRVGDDWSDLAAAAGENETAVRVRTGRWRALVADVHTSCPDPASQSTAPAGSASMVTESHGAWVPASNRGRQERFGPLWGDTEGWHSLPSSLPSCLRFCQVCFDFFLCPLLRPPLSFHRYPSCINISHAKLHPHICFQETACFSLSDKLEIGQYSTTTAFNHFSFETQTIQGKFYTDSNILQCI